MRSRTIATLGFLALLLAGLTPAAHSADLSTRAEQMLESDHVSGEVLFEVAEGVSAHETAAGAFALEIVEISENTFKATLPWWLSTKGALYELFQDPLVEIAEPNYRLKSLTAPTDTYFPDQWGIQDTTYGADALGAWSMGVIGRDDVFVAVLDTGIQVDHPELDQNIWVNQAELNGRVGFDDDGNGFVDDVHGYNFVDDNGTVFQDAETDSHGTHVAGIIGAEANGVGVVGVAQQVKMISVKFIDGENGGDFAGAIAGLDYVRDLKVNQGLNVVATNNSYGANDISVEGSELFQRAIERQGEAGILFVAAAGNETSDNDAFPSYPANYDCRTQAQDWDCVLSIASIDDSGELSVFSNFGTQSVDFAAPGGDIISTYPITALGYASGTSMAAPHVAGAAALCAAANPALNGEQIAAAITNNLKPINPVDNGKLTNDGILNIRATVADCLENASTLGRATVSGTLVDSVAEAPVVGALVELRFETRGENGEYLSHFLEAVTDANGSYSFFGLPTFDYLRLSSYGTADGGEGSFIKTATNFALYQDDAQRTINLNIDPIPTGTASISGRVIDDQGAPIQYINVGAELVASVAGDQRITGVFESTVTDTDGLFTIDSLPAGNFKLWASEDGFDMPNISYQEPVFESEYVTLATATSTLTVVDIVLPLIPLGTSVVRTQVWDNVSDSPAAGIRVCAQGDESSTATKCVESASDGAVEISGLVSGSYFLSAYRSTEYGFDKGASFTIGSSETRVVERLNIWKVDPADDSANLTILVRDGETLEPVSEGTAYLAVLNSFSEGRYANISSLGEATFAGIPRGIYQFSGSSGLSLVSQRQNTSIVLASGTKRASLSLERMNLEGTISGVIQDSYGQPVEGALVSASFVITYGCCEGEGIGSSTFSDETGFYRANNVPLGRELSVSVIPPGTNRNQNTLAAIDSTQTLTADTPQAVRNFELLEQGEIAGRLVLDGIGYSGAEIVAQNAMTGEEFGQTISAGGYYKIRGLSPGDYLVAVRPETMQTKDPIGAGFIDKTGASSAQLVYEKTLAEVFTVSPANTLSLPNVELSRGSRISGQVNFNLDSLTLRQSSRSAQVNVYRENGSGLFEAFEPLGQTSAFGYRIPSLELSGLPAGNYKLQFLNDTPTSGTFDPVFQDGASSLESAGVLTIGTRESVSISPVNIALSPPQAQPSYDFSSASSQEKTAKQDAVSLDTSGKLTKVFVGTDFTGEFVSVSLEAIEEAQSLKAFSVSQWSLVDQSGSVTLSSSDADSVAVADSSNRLIGWALLPEPQPVLGGGGGGGGGGFFLPPEPVFATPGLTLLEDRAVIPAGSTLEVPGGLKDIFVSGDDWLFRLTPAGQLDKAGYSQFPAGSESKLVLTGLVPGTDVVAKLSPASLQIASQGTLFDLMISTQSVISLGTFIAGPTGELDADVVVPRDVAAGDYTLSISALSPTGAIEFKLPTKVLTAVDLSFGVWTKKFGLTQGKMYAKNPIGEGKVEFFVNGKEIAWVRAADESDRKLRRVTEGPMAGVSYLVRTVDFVKGKNALEIYLDGERVWRAAYTLR
jgi:subtilisin family serine protease